MNDNPTGGLQVRDDRLLAWLRLARIAARVDQATAEHLRPWDLTVAQFDVLAQVGARPGLSQQALAGALLVTKGNVTQVLDRMEARGLVERRQEPGRRGNSIHLTADGWRLNREVVPAQERLIRDLFAGLADDEARALHRLLRTLDRGLTGGDERRIQE
jgi:DNA-binding MarR family transcriptional regulator